MIINAKENYFLNLGKKLSDPYQGIKAYWMKLHRLLKKKRISLHQLYRIYPLTWKRASIVPIHKKGSRQCKNNYRPISLLPILGKIFEKLLSEKIYSHLCEDGLLTPNQSGFRPGDSTVNQLLSITHKIYSAFEEIPSKVQFHI